jgi:nitroreductase
MVERTTIEAILDLARWAPSGDNTQNWRFEISADGGITIHGFDTRSHCVYDLDGHPSQISLGALIETLAVAASTHRLCAHVSRRAGMADTQPTFDIRLEDDPSVTPDPLAAQITVRSVQRRAMSTRRLSTEEKRTLERELAAGGYRVLWLERLSQRWQAARLMFDNAHLRLTMPEAYAVHRDIIDWGARFSADKVPDQALGADAATLKLMRWVMADWQRVEFFNRYLAGTLAPRLQMDLLPGVRCGAHFVLLAAQPARGIDDYVAAGRAMQRFWLAVTALGLVMQPELTPLIFARYVREGRIFSEVAAMSARAAKLAERLDGLLRAHGVGDTALAVFMGRVGEGPAATARSMRRPLAELMVAHGGADPHA